MLTPQAFIIVRNFPFQSGNGNCNDLVSAPPLWVGVCVCVLGDGLEGLGTINLSFFYRSQEPCVNMMNSALHNST